MRLATFVCALGMFVTASCAAETDLAAHFRSPEDVRLGAIWYWVSDNISEAGAVEDLKAMKAAGINLVSISNIGPSTHHKANYPLGDVKFMSEEWWRVLDTAMKTAGELGIDVALFNCPGWSQSGGPWMTESETMRNYVVDPATGEGRMVPTGAHNSPATREATGWECDKLNARHVRKHFDSYVGAVYRRIPPEHRRTWKYVTLDSWEKYTQNWTDGMPEKFRSRFGYDPTPFMAHPTAAFSNDLVRCVSDLVCDEYVGTMTRCAHELGLRTWIENYGHYGFPSESLRYGSRADEVAGEFWRDRHTDEKIVAASCAHTYGKPLVWAESFTFGAKRKGTWERTPQNIKRFGDLAMCQGVNAFMLHVYIQQYANDEYPGVDAWFGTEFNRKNSYWPMFGDFVTYLKRCSLMLQQGDDVSDLLFSVGDTLPMMHPKTPYAVPRGYRWDFVNDEVLSRGLPTNGHWRVVNAPIPSDLKPDFLGYRPGTCEPCPELAFAHRRTAISDIYFVANLSNHVVRFSGAFRDTRPNVSRWDPVTGSIATCDLARLELAPYESAFFVFSETPCAAAQPEPKLPRSETIEGPWCVTFSSDDLHRGPDKPVTFERLHAWRDDPDPAVRYYSGHATYENTFTLTNVEGRVFLSLGKLEAMARVWVNGRYVGPAWTPPFRLEVTEAVHPGENTLKIEVVSTWVNRILGDARLPVKERHLTPHTGDWNPARPLQTSGLLGPVTLETDVQAEGMPRYFIRPFLAEGRLLKATAAASR